MYAEKTENAKKDHSPRLEALRPGGFSIKFSAISGDPDFEAERTAWVDRFGTDEVTQLIANTAFLSNRRLARIYLTEEAKALSCQSQAPLKFDLQRHAEAVAADAQLLIEPWLAVNLLMATTVGCRRLLERVAALDEALAKRCWTDEHRKVMLAICGRGLDTVDPEVQELSDIMIRLQGNPDDPHFPEVAASLRHYFDSARRAFENRIAQLEEDQEEQIARALYVRASMIDDSPEGKALARALGQATRDYKSVMGLLERIAKTGKSTPASPPTYVPPPPRPRPEPRPEPPPAPPRNEAKWNLDGSACPNDRAAFVDVRIGDPTDPDHRKRRPAPPSKHDRRR